MKFDVSVHLFPRFPRQLADFVETKQHAAAKLLRSELQKAISTPGPPGSKPGRYPHKRTGKLHDDIDVRRAARMEIHVVSTAPYAVFVEKTRPFMSRILREKHREIVRRIAAQRVM